MDNVIAFPQSEVAAPTQKAQKRSMTLFVHVKCATLIVHLANTCAPALASDRVVES